MSNPNVPPVQTTVNVFDADLFWAISGANQGDGLDMPELCELGDIYQLERDAQPVALRFETLADGTQHIIEGSHIGASGDRIGLVARMVLMAPVGDAVEIHLIRNLTTQELYVSPLAQIAAKTDYTLIEAHDGPGSARLTDLTCVAFTAGTMITMADGASRMIEDIQPGEMVLTREHGAQPLRVNAKSTMRAHGNLAPVVISAGVLGNDRDLAIAPHHRVFIYRRDTDHTAPAREVLVEAKFLIDNTRIWQREGGYVDYYALVFDRHEIIYAEGVPAESLLVSDTTLHTMPHALSAEIHATTPKLKHAPRIDTKIDNDLLERIGRERVQPTPDQNR